MQLRAEINEAAFIEQVCSASGERGRKRKLQDHTAEKQRSEKRADELSRLIRKPMRIMSVNGKLSDKLFEQMLHDFELELTG